MCTDLFDYLTLACIIDDEVFCVHGGISPKLRELDDLRLIDRVKEIPHDGLVCDIMWSDPEEIQGWKESARGAGYLFGSDVFQTFMRKNGLRTMVRAHQLVMEGYKEMFNENLITIWSAPNYCYRCGNVAAILEFDERINKVYKRFESAPVETEGDNDLQGDFPLSHYIS